MGSEMCIRDRAPGDVWADSGLPPALLPSAEPPAAAIQRERRRQQARRDWKAVQQSVLQLATTERMGALASRLHARAAAHSRASSALQLSHRVHAAMVDGIVAALPGIFQKCLVSTRDHIRNAPARARRRERRAGVGQDRGEHTVQGSVVVRLDGASDVQAWRETRAGRAFFARMCEANGVSYERAGEEEAAAAPGQRRARPDGDEAPKPANGVGHVLAADMGEVVQVGEVGAFFFGLRKCEPTHSAPTSLTSILQATSTAPACGVRSCPTECSWWAPSCGHNSRHGWRRRQSYG